MSIIHNMYMIINWVVDWNQGHQEGTYHPTHRFRRLFLDLHLIGRRRCASTRVTILPPSWSRRGGFDTNHFKSCCCCNEYFATIDIGSIITKIHRRSVMIHGSMEAQFIGTKHNGIYYMQIPIPGKTILILRRTQPVNPFPVIRFLFSTIFN